MRPAAQAAQAAKAQRVPTSLSLPVEPMVSDPTKYQQQQQHSLLSQTSWVG
jgi:hypothetical protein